jgi:hypothetical protein
MQPRPTVDPHLNHKEEPPPFLGSWTRVYVAVVIYLAAVISLFAMFTQAYKR